MFYRRWHGPFKYYSDKDISCWWFTSVWMWNIEVIHAYITGIYCKAYGTATRPTSSLELRRCTWCIYKRYTEYIAKVVRAKRSFFWCQFWLWYCGSTCRHEWHEGYIFAILGIWTCWLFFWRRSEEDFWRSETKVKASDFTGIDKLQSAEWGWKTIDSKTLFNGATSSSNTCCSSLQLSSNRCFLDLHHKLYGKC